MLKTDTKSVPRPTKRGLRFIVAALLATFMATFVSIPASTSHDWFPDVPRDHQFRTEIDWIVGEMITFGYLDGTFKPRESITREAFAAFIYRLDGKPAVSLPAQSPFSDVDESARFYNEIMWLSGENITTGWADGTFRPKETISREAVAAFLYRYEGKPNFSVPSKSPFKDMTPSSKFYEEVMWLSQSGMTTGYADGNFRPKSNVSREATAAFLYRGYGVFSVDEQVEYEGIRFEVQSTDVVSETVARNESSYSLPDEDLLLLKAEVTELQESDQPMSCQHRSNPGIQMWDRQGNPIDSLALFDSELPENLPCDEAPKVGEPYEWTSVWAAGKGQTPYAITLHEMTGYRSWVVIYFEPNGPTIAPY